MLGLCGTSGDTADLLVQAGCKYLAPLESSERIGSALLGFLSDLRDGKSFTGNKEFLPKVLDEKVARLHLAKVGVELDILTDEQSSYLAVPKEGPFKAEHYRY